MVRSLIHWMAHWMVHSLVYIGCVAGYIGWCVAGYTLDRALDGARALLDALDDVLGGA